LKGLLLFQSPMKKVHVSKTPKKLDKDVIGGKTQGLGPGRVCGKNGKTLDRALR